MARENRPRRFGLSWKPGPLVFHFHFILFVQPVGGTFVSDGTIMDSYTPKKTDMG